MATPDKRYLCSDLVPGDVSTCQPFTNHCGNKGSIIFLSLESHLWLLTLLGRFDEQLTTRTLQDGKDIQVHVLRVKDIYQELPKL